MSPLLALHWPLVYKSRLVMPSNHRELQTGQSFVDTQTVLSAPQNNAYHAIVFISLQQQLGESGGDEEMVGTTWAQDSSR